MLALLSVVFALTLGVQAFINPIIPGFNPDPTLLVVGDDYFISTSTFEFFPGHPIYHSKDLVDWNLIGHALNRPSQLQLYGGAPESGAWAPTLRHYNGTFYLLTTVRRVYTSELRQQSRSYYVTTNDIFSNHWSDPIYIDGLGYDPDLLIDDDGTAYITRTDINNPVEKIYGIYQSIIDLPSGRTLSDTLIFNGTLPNNSTSRPEGPHLYKKGSYYYLILAEGGSSVYHRSTIVRSRNPSGPWEECPNNPLIYNGENPDPTTQPVQWTGHSDIAQLPDGSWWGVCLAVRPQGGIISRAQLGRESFLFPVQWGADDWPTFNNAEPLGLSGPGLRNRSYEESSFRDDFDTTKLDESYYFLRTPYSQLYSLDDRPGHLRLWGQALSLGDRDTPSVIFRKQVAFNQLFQTELDFQPQTPKQEAGLTVFYSDFYHQEIGITRHPADGSRCIVWRSRLNPNNTSPAQVNSANASLVHEEYYPIEATGPVTLAIQSENVRYNFGYGTAGGNVTYIGSVDALQVFTSPINYFLFKGVHFGIYSQGGERVMVNTPADFAYLVQETYAPDPS